MCAKMKRVAILLALGVAGCGGGGGHHASPAPFRASYVSLQNRYKAVGTELSQTLQQAQNSSNAELQTSFSDQASRLQALHSSLGVLRPPAAGSAYYAQYLAALARVAADLRTLSSEAAANQAASAKSTTATLLSDLNAGSDDRLAFEKAVGIS